MTVEADIYTLLKGLVGNRVYPDAAPFDTVRPFITYSQVGGEAINYVDDLVPNLKNGKFEVYVWSNTRAEVASLALQVEAAFITATAFQSRPATGPRAEHDPDLKLYGSQQDFEVWSVR